VFANQLALKLRQSFPTGSTGGSAITSPSSLTPSALDKLPPSVHVPLLHAYSGAIDAAFLVAAGVSVVAFAASWLIKALPMRDTVGTAGIGEAFAVPKEASSLREIARSLSLLVGREQGRQLMEGIARQAGVDLSAGEAWMLFRFEEDPHWDFAASALRRGVPVERMRQAQQSLRERGLLLPETPTEPGVPVVTPEGAVMSARLRDAGREQLETLLADWTPDQHIELAEMLGRLSADLADAPPTKASF
jgi:hypothetical protein